MSALKEERSIPKFGAFYVLEARIRAMLKFFWVIASLAILNPVLYLVSIGLGVGTLITNNIGPNGMDGVSYMTFIAPALLATSAIQGAVDEVVFPTLDGFKWTRIFYGINSTPQTGSTIATGVFLTAMVRTIVSVLAYSGILYLFGAMDSPHSYLAIPIAVLAGASFGAAILAFASHINNEDMFFPIVGRFVIGPMFLFSGTFYPLNTLPIGLQFFGWISPLWHATELGRYATYGHHISATMVIVHTLFLLAILVVGLIFAFKQYTRRLAK
ncbi:MAG: ABC transporter permease [Candidatus Nanopelagicaceae bacterium]|nr:ABC transporter permease [Candidatus Nanopelagicaceae bacterium]